MWVVWAVLAVALCGAAGLVGVYGVAQWRELSPGAAVPGRYTIFPTALVAGGVVLLMVVSQAFSEHPWSGWRGGALVLLAITGAATAGVAMLGVCAVTVEAAVPDGADLAACEAAVVDVMRLRQILQRLGAALGSLVALATLALGAGALLTGATPRQHIVVFGAVGSLVVAVFYAPAVAALRRRGQRLAAVVLAACRPRDLPDLVDRLDKRVRLEQLMGADRTLLGELQSAIPVLGPLIAGAAVLLPS